MLGFQHFEENAHKAENNQNKQKIDEKMQVLRDIDFERILDGFSAVVAQHECDHLDGILYVDRVETSTLAFLDEHRKYADELLEISFQGDN